MAQLVDSLIYRLAGVWWRAIYAGLCDSEADRASGAVTRPVMQQWEPSVPVAQQDILTVSSFQRLVS